MSKSVSQISAGKRPSEKNELEKLKAEYETRDHLLSVEELENKYRTSAIKGLTSERAEEILAKHGLNQLTGEKTTSKFRMLCEHLFLGFPILLWIGALLSFVGAYLVRNDENDEYFQQHLCLGIILVAVIFLTGIFGYYQEAINVEIMASFQKLVPKFANVIRDGQRMTIASEEVVVGDLVILQSGDTVPGDVRLLEVSHLKVDNSSITGESLPQLRSVYTHEDNPLEASNLAFYMTSVVEGNGKGIVIATSTKTVIGQIADLTSSIEKKTTPLRKEINRFIKVLTIVALATGAFFLIALLFAGYDFFESFAYFIAMTVATVPEGLPVTLVACMTLTAKAMAAKNCLVKKHEAIETLGCCNVICSDKTGTLTQNKMRVVHMYFDEYSHYIMDNEGFLDLQNRTLQALCVIGILCSTAQMMPDQDSVPIQDRKVEGDASEAAILKCMYALDWNVARLRRDFPKIAEIPFTSHNKYQLSIHNTPFNSYMIVLKGAPERVLPRCTKLLKLGKTTMLTNEDRSDITRQINHLGNHGERVLAFADFDLKYDEKYTPPYAFDVENKNFPMDGFRFVGLISMMDPPRPTVPNAVEKCRHAGIRVIMVTGDHPVTAAAIAKQVGILSKDAITAYDVALEKDKQLTKLTEEEMSVCTAAIITGNNLRHMTTSELELTLRTFYEIVFARTSPQQKLKIVEALQKMKQVVAVTGDGVNDSPALKAANIGVAMGISGSDVSKESADIILLDDNFASIVTGIEEGRLIFDNLKKSIAYLLTSKVPEICPFIFMFIYNIPPPLSAMAVILIDVGTDLWPAISLAYEQPEADIMQRAPRDPTHDTLINGRLIFLTYADIGVLQLVSCYLTYTLIMGSHGFFPEHYTGAREVWFETNKTLVNYFNESYDFPRRMTLTKECYAGYFLTLSVTQVADLLTCKTRRLSIFHQGMRNWVLNFSMIFEIFLSLFAVYTPEVNDYFLFSPCSAIVLLSAIPFGLVLFVMDEWRRYAIRKHPRGIVAHETYY